MDVHKYWIHKRRKKEREGCKVERCFFTTVVKKTTEMWVTGNKVLILLGSEGIWRS